MTTERKTGANKGFAIAGVSFAPMSPVPNNYFKATVSRSGRCVDIITNAILTFAVVGILVSALRYFTNIDFQVNKDFRNTLE